MPGLLCKVAERATGNLRQVEGAKLVLLHHLAQQGKGFFGFTLQRGLWIL